MLPPLCMIFFSFRTKMFYSLGKYQPFFSVFLLSLCTFSLKQCSFPTKKKAFHLPFQLCFSVHFHDIQHISSRNILFSLFFNENSRNGKMSNRHSKKGQEKLSSVNLLLSSLINSRKHKPSNFSWGVGTKQFFFNFRLPENLE